MPIVDSLIRRILGQVVQQVADIVYQRSRYQSCLCPFALGKSRRLQGMFHDESTPDPVLPIHFAPTWRLRRSAARWSMMSGAASPA